RPFPGCASWWPTVWKGCSTSRRPPTRSPTRWPRCWIATGPTWDAGPARASSAITAGRPTARRWTRRSRDWPPPGRGAAIRNNEPVRVRLVTDSFPPHCGGSGWSTYELARGLRARGVDVGLVRPRPGAAHDARHEYDGFAVDDIAAPAPRTPFVRNYFK